MTPSSKKKLRIPEGREGSRRNKFILLMLNNACINKCFCLKYFVPFHFEMKIGRIYTHIMITWS